MRYTQFFTYEGKQWKKLLYHTTNLMAYYI